MNGALEAGFWGLVGGSALVIGAACACVVELPQRLIAAIMAVGAGVLISAVAFDLMDEAYTRGGFDSTAEQISRMQRQRKRRLRARHVRG